MVNHTPINRLVKNLLRDFIALSPHRNHQKVCANIKPDTSTATAKDRAKAFALVRKVGYELWREEHFKLSELAHMWKFDSKTIQWQIQADPDLVATVQRPAK